MVPEALEDSTPSRCSIFSSTIFKTAAFGLINIDSTFAPPTMIPATTAAKRKSSSATDIFEEPRWIMDQCLTDWVDLHPTKLHQICCGGGGGTLTTGYNEERIFYGRRKMDQIRATGAQMMVLPCHSCHGQINAIKETYEMKDLSVKYLWELVADCLSPPLLIF
jgi:hypothetical protein